MFPTFLDDSSGKWGRANTSRTGKMAYSVKEILNTLQGEGARAGTSAVFCRFTGCNLWSGREADRASAVCRFCDTEFVGTDGPGGGRFEDAAELGSAIEGAFSGDGRPLVVCTGGEPLLQLDAALIEELHRRGIEVAVETNGTIAPPAGLDWVCVSPKAGAECIVRAGDELKLVFPQPGADASRFESWEFDHFFVQPMDGPDLARNIERAVRFCKENPRWRLSLQTHKLIGIP